MIKAVIFDFGRVISSAKPMSLFQAYEKELGLEPGELNRVMYGSAIWQQVLLGRVSQEDYWREIGPQLGLKTAEEIRSFRARYFGDESVNEEVRVILEKLHGYYKLAVLSNAPPRLNKWLSDWDLLELFDLVVCSGEEGIAKPDPAIYERTLERLHVLPGEAVFIDDTLGHVEVARKMGLHGIHFTTAATMARDLAALLEW